MDSIINSFFILRNHYKNNVSIIGKKNNEFHMVNL